MQDPAFLDDLRVRILSGQEVLPPLPKSLLKKKIPNDLNPSLRKSFILHLILVGVYFVHWGYSKFWVSDLEKSQVLREQKAMRTAIRVDLVDLPSLKLSEMSKIDLNQEPDSAQKIQEDNRVETPEISPTAMVDKTQQKKDSLVVDDLSKGKEKKDKLKALQDSLRAEQKRKELIAGLQKKRPLLGGNIVSEGYSLTGDVASDKEAFSGKVQAHVSKNFHVPSWMNSSKLKAEVLVKVAPDGRLVSSSIIQSSGDSEFDSAASRAIEKSDPFPTPPESLKRIFLEEGITCAFP
jgi:TonB family protein